MGPYPTFDNNSGAYSARHDVKLRSALRESVVMKANWHKNVATVESLLELLSIGVEKHQAAFSSGTWLTGTPLTYLAPW